MFGKSTTESTGGGAGVERYGHSVIQEGVTIRGEVEAKGDFRLDGRIEGRISVSERLTVGEKGVAAAQVEAGEVVVMGEVQGKIEAHRRLELRKGARVVGDVTTPTLVIEEGVHFHGNSNMEVQKGATPILKTGTGPSKPGPTPITQESEDSQPKIVSGAKGYR